MKKLFALVSAVGLVLVIGPPLLYLAGGAEVLAKGRMQMLMLVGTILWFVTVPLWMGRKSGQEP